MKLNMKVIEKIKNNLIVSCQAVDDEPLNNVKAITLMAKACVEGGATVLRLSKVKHIKNIKKMIKGIFVIGLIKKKYEDSEVYITATTKEVKQLIKLKVDVIALDATSRKRPNDQTLSELVTYCRKNAPKTLLMADCATMEDIKNAELLKFDLISTTLRGYTKESAGRSNIENNYEFIKNALKQINIPLVAEGGIWEPNQVNELLKLGCYSVVVGTAITRPKEITKRFMKAIT